MDTNKKVFTLSSIPPDAGILRVKTTDGEVEFKLSAWTVADARYSQQKTKEMFPTEGEQGAISPPNVLEAPEYVVAMLLRLLRGDANKFLKLFGSDTPVVLDGESSDPYGDAAKSLKMDFMPSGLLFAASEAVRNAYSVSLADLQAEQEKGEETKAGKKLLLLLTKRDLVAICSGAIISACLFVGSILVWTTFLG